MLSVVDLNCIGSIKRWCTYWNVSRIQLEIAAKRVGSDPIFVARELGLGAEQAVTAQVQPDAT
jgi:hypothetical protein